MSNLTLATIIQFCVAVSANVGALGLLPLTVGFSRLGPTSACIGLFILNIWMIARLIEGGAPLSLLAPIMAAVIPLTTIAIGIFFYGESSAPLRIALLVGACALMAIATLVQS